MGFDSLPHDRPAGESNDSVESRFSLSELWLAIRNNWWLVVLVSVVAIAGAFFYTSKQVRMYRAHATLRFEPRAPRPLGEDVRSVVDMEADYWNRKEYYNTQYWVIRAKSTAIPVVKELALHRDVGFVRATPATEKSPEPLLSIEDAAAILRSRLEVTPIEDSRLASVSYTDADPERAARVLAAVVDVYARANQDELRAASDDAAEWLSAQMTTLKDKLEASELKLHEYKKEKHILSVSVGDQTSMLRAEMAQLNEALTKARTERAKIGARRDQLRKIEGDNPVELPVAELMNSPILGGLRDKYVAAAEQLEALIGAGKGNEHPEVAATRARKETSRKLLLQEVANIKASVEKDYAALSEEIGSLQTLYEDAKERALELNLLGIEYKRLQRTRDTNEKLYGLVTERSKESDLTRMLHVNNVRVVDRPEVPRAPFAPNVPMNLGGGVVAGLLLGLALAIGREQLDSRIKTPEVVESILGVPFLGLLPSVRADGGKASKKRGRTGGGAKRPPALAPRSELLVHEEPASSMAEAVRAVRTNLMLSERGAPPEALLVTSAAPADGKTTVACAVATSLAHAGQRVVLVDCDMRRPRLHRVFGMPNDRGVTTALSDLSALDEALVDVPIDRLTLLPSGRVPESPAELLHSAQFTELLRELRSRFDRVVIDSPPLIPVTDAAVLSKQVDGTLVVVRAFETESTRHVRPCACSGMCRRIPLEPYSTASTSTVASTATISTTTTERDVRFRLLRARFLDGRAAQRKPLALIRPPPVGPPSSEGQVGYGRPPHCTCRSCFFRSSEAMSAVGGHA